MGWEHFCVFYSLENFNIMIIERLTVFPYKTIWLGVIWGEGVHIFNYRFQFFNGDRSIQLLAFSESVLVSHLFLESDSNFVVSRFIGIKLLILFCYDFLTCLLYLCPLYFYMCFVYVCMFYPMINLNHKIVYFFFSKKASLRFVSVVSLFPM